MRLVTFLVNDQARIGVSRGDHVIDLNLARAMFLASHKQQAQFLATDMLDLIRQGEAGFDAANETLEFLGLHELEGVTFHAGQFKLLAPILMPPKIVAIGLNYFAHRQEQNDVAIPAYPVLFPKFPTAVIGSGEPITYDPAVTSKVDYEAELGVVIGKTAKRVAAQDALNYVFGYCNLNDVSARDLQFDEAGAKQWTRGKSLDTFCPIGPYLVTKDEIADPQALPIRCLVNGQVVQEATTGDMIAGVAQLIEFITQSITLVPGDIIATGTPPGVGHYRKPPVYLKPGDVVQVEIQGLGTLTNPIQ